MTASADLRARIGVRCVNEIADWTLRLVRAPSPNPPLETRVVAEEPAAILRAAVPRADLSLHDAGSGVINLVASVQGAGPGRRVVFNGHLDTYPGRGSNQGNTQNEKSL